MSHQEACTNYGYNNLDYFNIDRIQTFFTAFNIVFYFVVFTDFIDKAC